MGVPYDTIRDAILMCVRKPTVDMGQLNLPLGNDNYSLQLNALHNCHQHL